MKKSKYELIGLKPNVKEMLDKCKDDFVKNNPNTEEFYISYNKIVYEIALFYLKNE